MAPATAPRARSSNRSSATTSRPSQIANANTSRPSTLARQGTAVIGGTSPASRVAESTPAPAKSADTSSRPSVGVAPAQDGAPAASAAPPMAEFTLADLAKHKKFTAINGKVYDLTNFKHPGGPFTIAAVMGKDGTSEFKAKHGAKMEKNLKSKGIKVVGVLVK